MLKQLIRSIFKFVLPVYLIAKEDKTFLESHDGPDEKRKGGQYNYSGQTQKKDYKSTKIMKEIL